MTALKRITWKCLLPHNSQPPFCLIPRITP